MRSVPVTRPSLSSSSWALALGVACVALGAGACQSGLPPVDSPARQEGTLGNGSFLFACDDSVSCNSFKAFATKFPDKVAQGASFHVQFYPTDNSYQLTESVKESGASIGTVGSSFLSFGPSGITGLKAGVGTITVMNAQGALVDFISINIAKPDALVVYDATYSGTSPAPVTTLTLAPNDTKSFRTLARETGHDLAGAFESEWTPADPSVVSVTGYDGAQANLLAGKVGTTTIAVAGAGLTQTIQVTVQVSQ